MKHDVAKWIGLAIIVLSALGTGGWHYAGLTADVADMDGLPDEVQDLENRQIAIDVEFSVRLDAIEVGVQEIKAILQEMRRE